MKTSKQEKLLEAAEKVVDSIKSKIGHYTEEPPKVLNLKPGTVLVSWSEGPFEWTLNDGLTLYQELVGAGMNPNPESKLLKDSEPFYSIPNGFEAEAENGYLLQLRETKGNKNENS